MPLINPGERAPTFTLRDQQNKARLLKDFAGRILVVMFYPRDDSASSAAQACQFRDAFADFTKVKATVVGISPNDIDSHARFDARHTLGFPLLADEPGKDGVPRVCGAYGVWVGKGANGRGAMGIVRTTYLLGPDGVVVRRWDHVRVPGHAGEVLEAVRAMHSGRMAEPRPSDRRVRERAAPRARARRSATKKTRTHDSDPQYTPVRGSRMTLLPGRRAGKGGHRR